MEFTVKRNALLGELNLVQGVIERKSTIPILSNILLETTGESLNITATDLDVSVCCGCTAEVLAEGTTSVSARHLFDIVRLLPEDADIHFSLLENDWVKLQFGKAVYRVVALPKENFPSIPEFSGTQLSIPGSVLSSLIQRTMFAITQEESRYSLNGALLTILPQEIRMVATDGHRLALVSNSVDIPSVDLEISALIPRKTLVEIQKLIGDQNTVVEYGRDENHLFFTIGGKRLVSRILAGQFPNYEMVIPRENDKSIFVGTQNFADAVRRAKVMSDQKLKSIRLSVSPGMLELTASSAEAGEAKEVVPAEYDGPSLEIGFNPDYLLDFLSVCGSEKVEISVRDSETQGLLRPVGESSFDYRYVVMPMKF
jgi:DNA polymerase III subunit beta